MNFGFVDDNTEAPLLLIGNTFYRQFLDWKWNYNSTLFTNHLVIFDTIDPSLLCNSKWIDFLPSRNFIVPFSVLFVYYFLFLLSWQDENSPSRYDQVSRIQIHLCHRCMTLSLIFLFSFTKKVRGGDDEWRAIQTRSDVKISISTNSNKNLVQVKYFFFSAKARQTNWTVQIQRRPRNGELLSSKTCFPPVGSRYNNRSLAIIY